MREVSVYYVPNNQSHWCGRGEALIAPLWQKGIFLRHPQPEDYPLLENALNLEGKFAEMGLVDSEYSHPVPNEPYPISCQACGDDLTPIVIDSWSLESTEEPGERLVSCRACQVVSPTRNLCYPIPMTFARFYIYVSDCDPDDWPAAFRVQLEEFVGPCQEFWERCQ